MAWGTGTTVDDAESYEGGLSLDMGTGPEDEIEQVAPVETSRNNIEFYLDEDYELPAQASSAPVEQNPTQALFDLFALGQVSGQTPYGQIKVSPSQKSFGFLFNKQPAPFLGQNVTVSPFVNVGPGRGMIGVRGDF